jgi:dehydrodolichyl diphosphate syntase complex subunit NUS1
MVGLRQAQAFHHDTDVHGRKITAAERERLLKPYLPERPLPAQSSHSSKKQGLLFHHKQRIRPALRHVLYSLIFNVVHIIFAIYINLRKVYHAIHNQVLSLVYYHHHTPELIQRDVKKLAKVPKHLSVILELQDDGDKKDGLETLLHDACELAAWTASAGISTLSIYERTGILKATQPHLHRRISRSLATYFGAASASKPTFSLRAPHVPSYSPPHSPGPSISADGNHNDEDADAIVTPHHLTILLIDETDGRQTFVDLTKTLAEMSQRGKLSPADISGELIDAEISESVMGEPDLLILFGGRVVLDGYPPWQVRLTEIYYAQDHEGGVGYQIFLQALYKYAKAEFRIGR